MLETEMENIEKLETIDCSDSLAFSDDPVEDKFILLDDKTKDEDLILSQGFRTFFKYNKDIVECQIDECTLHIFENDKCNAEEYSGNEIGISEYYPFEIFINKEEEHYLNEWRFDFCVKCKNN